MNTSLSLNQIRDMDLVSYLQNLGFEPEKIRGNDYWYRSPFREEKVASFKVNIRLNRWYDFGEGAGGNLIDFAIRYQDCSISEFLRNLSGSQGRTQALRKRTEKSYPADQPLQIIQVESLRSKELIAYLHQRRVSIQISDQYCKEVHYRIGEKQYYAIGFPNQSGGYELRNPYFKGSSSPKDISLIAPGNDQLFVFEGFIDFLTFKTIHPQFNHEQCSYLILNSISLFKRATPYLESYKQVGLFLDRDPAGRACTRQALEKGKHFQDNSFLYKNFKDLNDWAMNLGKNTQA